MSHEAFQAATKPKVQGSWNLHTLLPQGLDFFILLSSIAGIIGAPGQANYAAGNTYQDALARHRVAHGEKAASIDLGVVASSVYVAEHPEVMDAVGRRGYPPIDEAELFSLLSILCDPATDLLSPDKSQILLGLMMPAALHAQGYEEPSWMLRRQFSTMYNMDGDLVVGAPATIENAVATSTALAAAQSVVQAAKIITDALVRKLSKTLSVAPENIDVNRPMHVLGVDSLVSVEIRNWFSKVVNAKVNVLEILSNESIFDMSVGVAKADRYESEDVVIAKRLTEDKRNEDESESRYEYKYFGVLPDARPRFLVSSKGDFNYLIRRSTPKVTASVLFIYQGYSGLSADIQGYGLESYV